MMSKQSKLVHVTGLFLVLTGLWLILSGYYKPLLLSLGLFSVVFVIIITLRMQLIEYEKPEVNLQIIKYIPYWFWLAREIFKSNIDVCKRILNPTLPISPTLVWVKSSQKNDLARVYYANSITLTPGTISIDVENNDIEVHTLSKEGAEGLLDGKMDKQVSRSELT